MDHPEPTFQTAQLFTAGSYGVDICHAGDGLKNAPRQGWCQLSVIREAVIASITFGSDVSGGDKIVGQTLKVGTYLWARILSIELASGLIELRRGRFNPGGAVMAAIGIELPASVMVDNDLNLTLLSWTGVAVEGYSNVQIWKNGVFFDAVPLTVGPNSYTIGTPASFDPSDVWQVFLVR